MRLTWNKVSPTVWELSEGPLTVCVEARSAGERWVASLQGVAGRSEVRVFRYRTNAELWCEQELAAYQQSHTYSLTSAVS